MYTTRLSKKNKKTSTKKNKQEIQTTTMEAARQNSQVSFITPTQKRLSDTAITRSPLMMMQMMDKRFDKLTEQLTEHLQTMMGKMLNECKDSLLSEIDKKFNVLMSDINKVTERVTNLETSVEKIKNSATNEMVALNHEIEKLKTEIIFLKNCARNQENSIVAYDIRVTNVPTVPNENLYNFYGKLCEIINITPPNIKSIFRVKINKNSPTTNRNTRKNRNTLDAAIIIKFQCPYERNFVLKSITSFIKYRGDSLRLNLIGYESSVPFFVNENLTPNNHRIFLQANRLKKDGLISAAFINRGLVYIRQQKNDEPTCVNEIDQLNKLFPAQGHDDDDDGSRHGTHDKTLLE